jgi:hypothetical protein
MRLGVVLALAVGTFVLCVQAAFATGNDRGLLRPPEQLSESAKTIWMGEWVACRHERLGRLAKIIGIRIPSGRAPQVAATLIAKKAEAPLWDLASDFATAVDGCRNGILWRYYHEDLKHATSG